MWVCENGGNINAGNALISSAVSGYGQRQSDNLLRTCTIGKATESVNWDQVEETVTRDGKKSRSTGWESSISADSSIKNLSELYRDRIPFMKAVAREVISLH